MEYSLSKVAKELGISKASVSLVLNGHAAENHISDELKNQVLDFCKKVNYIPNIHAQRVNQKYVKNVGLLIDENTVKNGDNPFSDPNVSGIIGGVVLAASKKSYRVTIELYNDSIKDAKIFNWLRSKEIDGLIYYGLNLKDNWYNTFTDEERAVIGIGIAPKKGIHSVNINNYKLMYELTDSVIKSGKSNILFLSGVDCYVNNERENGFSDRAVKDKINFEVVCCDFIEETAENTVRNIFSRQSNRFDAIICANDDMAIGAIKALNSLKISIPQAVAVTGADNIKIGAYISPQLTTMDNMCEELGKCAFNTFYEARKSKASADVLLDSRIVYRKTL